MSKFIFITGCSTGIGYCAAKTLKDRGYQVIASVRKAEDMAALQSEGFEHVLQVDLRDSVSIDAAVKRVMEICNGALYALFNNGAYGQAGAVEDLSRDALRLQFETNVFGTHELTAKILPYMLKNNEGRIIQNSSVLGFVAMPMRGAYNASKFALEGLSDTLRLELSNTNINVVLIQPGPIVSHFRKNSLAALQQNINIKNSRHKEGYEGAIRRLSKAGPTSRFTLSADAVVKKLIAALESKRPKSRYYVTFPTYLFAYLRHVLPTAWLDKILILAASGEAKS